MDKSIKQQQKNTIRPKGQHSDLHFVYATISPTKETNKIIYFTHIFTKQIIFLPYIYIMTWLRANKIILHIYLYDDMAESEQNYFNHIFI